jgi:uncharacterized protein (DUF433 family)
VATRAQTRHVAGLTTLSLTGHTPAVGHSDRTSRALAAEAGCYEAWRAAALSGVPESTVYYWARNGLVKPSISPVKEKLWSYGDLMALRIISWLRHSKRIENDIIRASPMTEVRRTLALLDTLDLDIWRGNGGNTKGASPLLVDKAGKMFLRTGEGLLNSHGQKAVDLPIEFFDLLAPFELAGQHGPDLLRPRPHLRIVPLKVAGEPHIVDSRITSRSLAALSGRGFEPGRIAEMYRVDHQSVIEALDLESQLAPLRSAA